MIYFIPFIILLITILFLIIFFKYRITIIEYVILIIIDIFITIIMYFSMNYSNITKIEYLGYYITSIKHFDKWDEWIKKTCEERIDTGLKDQDGNKVYKIRKYDCSYRKVHDEYWVMIDNDGNTYYISESYFNMLLNKWKTPMIFIDMNRRYYKIDGDCQQYMWNKVITDSETTTKTHYYTNKIQSSNSIFNFETITKEDKAKYSLFNYPDIKNYCQETILGLDNIKYNDRKYFNYVNGYLGTKCEFRAYLLCFRNKPSVSGLKQRSYWINGNKNEFVICIGLDDNDSINWVNTFDWSDKTNLNFEIENYLLNNKLNIIELSELLLTKVPKYWSRKNFSDFDYLKPELTVKQYIIIIILLFIINIITSIIIIKNEINPI